MVGSQKWGVASAVLAAPRAEKHAGAMHVTMTMMRPGLFLQREEPGSEPGNSLVLHLVRPDGHM
jgi:hypothetical protein